MRRSWTTLVIGALAVFEASAERKDLMDFEINLDLAPEHRYDALFDTELGPQFNQTVWSFYEQYL